MNKIRTKRNGMFIMVFMLSFFLCMLVTTAYIKNKSQLEYAQMEHFVSTKVNKVNNVISKLLYRTQTLAALVIQNTGEVHNFEQVAATILDDPAIRNVILAPSGVVSHVYPLEGNEKVIGLDYFSEGEGNKEAVQAKESGQLVLGGPFNLIQGGQALVGRLPVYLKNQDGENTFWGLVSVTLNYPDALDGAELDQLQNQGFAYEIWRISPDTEERQIIANSTYYYNPKAPYVEQEMQVQNAVWYFRLSPIKNWYEYPETWIYSFCGLMISFLLAFLVIHNYDLKEMKSELEDLTQKDALTGILNRRGIFQMIEKLISTPGQNFILCYMDLNKFKRINDTYGHNTGDMILLHFVNAIRPHLTRQQLFARIGGDEFILVFKNTQDSCEVSAFFQKLSKELSAPINTPSGESISLSFSYGQAAYPSEESSIDSLIAHADNAMYKAKTAQDL